MYVRDMASPMITWRNGCFGEKKKQHPSGCVFAINICVNFTQILIANTILDDRTVECYKNDCIIDRDINNCIMERCVNGCMLECYYVCIALKDNVDSHTGDLFHSRRLT